MKLDGEIMSRNLTGDEGNDLLMMMRNAVHADGCVVPPLLNEEEPLIGEAERRLLPRRIAEAVVLGQRLDAGWRVRLGRCARRVDGKADRLAQRFLDQRLLLARRDREVKCPIEIGKR